MYTALFGQTGNFSLLKIKPLLKTTVFPPSTTSETKVTTISLVVTTHPIPPSIHPPTIRKQMNTTTSTKPKFTHDPLLHYLYNNIIVSVAFSPGLIPSFPLSLEPDGERIILGPRREKRGKGRRVEGRKDDSLLFQLGTS